MKRLSFIILLLIQTAFVSNAQTKMTTQEYISIYSDLAIASMLEYQIPASIKMAQAILESASGNSRLAVKANNHFGIKCKTEWTGETISHDDDAKGECFRKYSSAYDSFIDHSEFLSKRSYYTALFDLDITDYKGWAHGLKKAGYATSPTYATALIKIIDDNKLYELDERALNPVKEEIVEIPVKPEPKREVKEEPTLQGTIYKGVIADKRNFVEVSGGSAMTTYINNGAKFVIARKGYTFGSISKITGKSIKKLLAYNDLETITDYIQEGSIIYVASKKSKASNGYDFHRVAKGETLHYVSQKYGIKIDRLAKLNLYNRNYIIKVGQKMLLR